MHKIPDKYQPWAVYTVLTIIILAVFWQVYDFEFIDYYDDDTYVTQNSHISTGLTIENIVWVFTSEHSFNWHPLTGLSHIVDCQLFGLNPGLHHLVNLLFHIINTLLLFTVLRQMSGAIGRSAFVAAVFAIHPLHVESVAWISERKDVLSTLFWFLTMAAYFRYIKNPKTWRYILTFVLFALGLMAKPMLVTLPFVLLLLDYWPLNRFETDPTGRIKWQEWRHLVWEKIPLFTLSVASSVVTFLVQKSAGAVWEIEAFPAAVRTANAIVSYVKYIVMMFLPRHLAVFYPLYGEKLDAWRVSAAFILLMIITICVIRFGSKYRYLPVGWLWYLGTLVPVIGLVQVGEQAMADRYTYVTLTGLFIIIAWGINDLLQGWRHQKFILNLSSFAVILALCACAWFQTSYWRNNSSLFQHALKVTKGNYVIYNNLGALLSEQGKPEEAIVLYHQAIEAVPDYPNALNNLGIAYYRLGRDEEAIQTLKQAVQTKSDFAEAYYNLGVAYNKTGRYQESAEAFRSVIKIKPDDAEAYYNLGVVCGRIQRHDEEIESYNRAIAIKPDFAKAYDGLGCALVHQNKFDQAITYLQQAIKLDPNSPTANRSLLIALIQQGRIEEAVAHAGKALRIMPDQADLMDKLAWISATRKETAFYNPQQAVKLAERACELSDYANAGMLDTLGVAYAAVNRFSEAVVTAERALKIAQSAGNKSLTDQIQQRLALYKKNQPYIEAAPK